MNNEKYEDIRRQCIIKMQPTGVIQEALMNQGMSLAEADIIIEKWYKGLPNPDWFDGFYDYLCSIRVSSEYDIKKLANALKSNFEIELCWSIRYLTGVYEADLFYNSSISNKNQGGS